LKASHFALGEKQATAYTFHRTLAPPTPSMEGEGIGGVKVTAPAKYISKAVK
jgi:hypothetical protein